MNAVMLWYFIIHFQVVQGGKYQRMIAEMTHDRGRARGPAGFDAPFNMGSTKCEIEWNSNFEVRYLTD